MKQKSKQNAKKEQLPKPNMEEHETQSTETRIMESVQKRKTEEGEKQKHSRIENKRNSEERTVSFKNGEKHTLEYKEWDQGGRAEVDERKRDGEGPVNIDEESEECESPKNGRLEGAEVFNNGGREKF